MDSGDPPDVVSPATWDVCGVQSSSAGAASEELFDLKGAGDLILPADRRQPNDPRIFVMDPKAHDAWRTQVPNFQMHHHCRRIHPSSSVLVDGAVTFCWLQS